MSIVCPKCETEYALDPAQLSVEGTPVQCSACEHTFTAYPQDAEEGTAGSAAAPRTVVPRPGSNASSKSHTQSGGSGSFRPPGSARRPHSETGGSGGFSSGKTAESSGGVVPPPPHLKSPAGRLFLAQGDRIYKVKDIATLQRWVVEKRVLPNDRLSRDGKSWDVVSSVAELRPFFTVLDQLKETKRALSKARKSNAQKLETGSPAGASVSGAQPSLRRETPPPVLPPGRPAQSPLGSESLAVQERAVVSGAEDVSAGAATPMGVSAIDDADVGVPSLTEPHLAAGLTSTAESAEETEISEHEGGAAEEVQTDPATSAPIDESGPIATGLQVAEFPPPSESLDGTQGDPSSTEQLPGATSTGVEGSDQSFFGMGTSTGELSDDEDEGVPDPFDVGASRSGAMGSPDHLETRTFTQSDSLAHAEGLPEPDSSDEGEGSRADDYDPDQMFDQGFAAPEEKKGAGLGFYIGLGGVAALVLAVGWYFLMGPGRAAVVGDTQTAAKAVPSATPAEAIPGTPVDPVNGEAAKLADAAIASDANPKPDPSVASPASVTPAAAPKKASAAPTPTPIPASAAAPWMEPAKKSEPPSEPAGDTSAKPPRASKPAPAGAKESPKPAANAASMVKAGDRARDRGDYRGAAKSYSEALKLEPSDVGTHIELGWAYIELGRNREAVTYFLKAVDMSPARSEAHYGLGLAYQTMGLDSQAIAEYRQVIKLDPNGRDTREVQALLRQLE